MLNIKQLLLLGIIAVCGGVAFYLLHTPIPFLLGSMIAVLLFQVLRAEPHVVPRTTTMFAQSIIGLNIGMAFSPGIYREIGHLILPLAGYLLTILLLGLLAGYLLYKMSGLDPLTALFCCAPGGASEMIGLADEFKVDAQIVAVYHSFRIVFIISFMSFFIPWLDMVRDGARQVFNVSQRSLAGGTNIEAVLGLLLISAICFTISKRVRIPASALFISLIVGILLNTFVLHMPKAPLLFNAVGQLVLGIAIGSRFNQVSLRKINRLKYTIAFSILLTVFSALVLGVAFSHITSENMIISLLSIVPGGASEMATIAFSLGYDVTMVTTIQFVRLFAVFIVGPKVILEVNSRLLLRHGKTKSQRV
ncbi:MAG: hypothetical protein VR68_08930 [Peptococcaceae bacterium BRH_c4a]|nr:MAG: hypothetical protein VR68_08930 [Peptococcaceae bacterium BRH_c4a]